MNECGDFANLNASARANRNSSKKFAPPSFDPDGLRKHIAALPPKHTVWQTIRMRELSMVYGRSNAGKTTLLLDIACSVLERDQTVLGQYATLPGDVPKVAWISGERDLEDIVDKLGKWKELRGQLRFYDLFTSINLHRPPGWMMDIIEEVDLIVIDTCMTAFRYDRGEGSAPVSMKEGAYWGALSEAFKPALQRHNTAMLLSHHSPKGGDTAGTPYGDLCENHMDQIIKVEKAAGKEVDTGGQYEGAQLFIESYKQRGRGPFPKTFARLTRANEDARLRLQKVDARPKD